MKTDAELDQLMAEARELLDSDTDDLLEMSASLVRLVTRFDDALAAVRGERDWLLDKVDGLETELESAVEVAFKRGAVEWTRLNYPETYARQIARQALQGDTHG